MISVTILTKNSQKYLLEVLTALQSFEEVLLYDNGSTDLTLAIAAQFSNVTIEQGPFLGFGPTHNQASALAKGDWILSLDSDEVISPELVQEIQALSLQKDRIYSFPRHNYYNGKLIRWCGWYPDCQMRLYHKEYTQFSTAQVHEALITEGKSCIQLHSPIKHYSYETHGDFLTKMQLYSDLFAKQHAGTKHSSLLKAMLHRYAAFLKAYILKRGIFGGYEGFVISTYNANTAFYKYLKLEEANQKLDKEKNP